MAALYRKYRPQDFDEVVGQEAIVRTLKNAITSGQVRQAYLFAGPRGTGKTSLARILAKGLNCVQGPTPTPDKICNPCVDDRQRHLARRDRDGRGLAARDRRHPRDPGARRPAAGRGALQGLHPRRGAPAHGRRLERAAQADRGASAPPRLRLLHDRPVEGAADRALALPDVRLRAAAAAGARAVAAPRRRRRGHPGARPGTGARRARRARSFRDAVSTLDQLASATENEITVQSVLQLLGAVEEEALFRLCDLVVDRDTAGRADVRRGAVGAGPGSRPARGRPARAPAPPDARPAHGRGAGHAPGHRGDARAAARAGEPARRGDRASVSSTCWPSRSRTCARAAIRACRSSSRS